MVRKASPGFAQVYYLHGEKEGVASLVEDPEKVVGMVGMVGIVGINK